MDKKGMIFLFLNFEVGNRDKLRHYGYDRGHLESWSDILSTSLKGQCHKAFDFGV